MESHEEKLRLATRYIYNPIVVNPDIVRSSYSVTDEELFLSPDGVTKRYPIHSGYGRYVLDTLTIFNITKNRELEKDTEYVEEDNGIFFRFINPPATGDRFKISYAVREDDYNFSTGNTKDTPAEEYFLFPNWLDSPGLGDAFWVGKYISSHYDATRTEEGTSNIPQSKIGVPAWTFISQKTATEAVKSKGTGFHLMLNREYASIAYWIHFKGLETKVKGNLNGYSDPENVDGNGTSIKDISDNKKFLPDNSSNTEKSFGSHLVGLGPDTWRHNLKENGIADFIGNFSKFVNGITINYRGNDRGYAIHVLDKTNSYYSSIREFDPKTDVLWISDILSSRSTGWNILNKTDEGNKKKDINIYYEDDKFKYEGIQTNNSSHKSIKVSSQYDTFDVFDFNSKDFINNNTDVSYYGAIRSGNTRSNNNINLWNLTIGEYKTSEIPFDKHDHIGFFICKEL